MWQAARTGLNPTSWPPKRDIEKTNIHAHTHTHTCTHMETRAKAQSATVI